MAINSLTTRYEALLTAVREALEIAEDGNYSHKDAREGIECVLADALEEVGEEADET